MKERLATYTVEVPIRFTFASSSNLDCKELHDACKKELKRRLENGYFDVLENKVEVVDKDIHYTREEKIEREKYWQMIFGR